MASEKIRKGNLVLLTVFGSDGTSASITHLDFRSGLISLHNSIHTKNISPESKPKTVLDAFLQNIEAAPIYLLARLHGEAQTISRREIYSRRYALAPEATSYMNFRAAELLELVFLQR